MLKQRKPWNSDAPKSNTPELIYTPESQLRQPGRLVQEMISDLLASRDLAWRLMVRDISAQYRQSLLGIFWAFVPAITAAMGLSLASNAKVLNVGTTTIPYAAYVMLSMTLWQTFAESLNGPIQAVTSAKAMLSKINFPREALILSQLGQVFFNFAVKLILIVGLFIWFKLSVPWSVVLAPVALIHLIALGTFIGLLLAPIGALYQDVSKAMVLVVGAWLFLTPVLYPIPESGTMAALMRLNPVTPLLVTTRELATIGVISDPIGFWRSSIIALVGLLLAWIVYRLAMPFVVERMSA